LVDFHLTSLTLLNSSKRNHTIFQPTAASSTTTDAEHEWNINKAKWDTFISGGSTIEMVYQERFQVIEYSLPYRVTVKKDGTVSKVRQMDGRPVNDDNIIRRMRTVDQTFQLIRDAWVTADSVAATYDAEKGHPTECNIDPISGAADDEIIIKISNVIRR
jgi:hypothetical protein